MSVYKVEHSKDKSKFIIQDENQGGYTLSQEDIDFIARFAKSQPLNETIGQTIIFKGYNSDPDNKYIKVAIKNTILAKDDDVTDYTSFCLTYDEALAIFEAAKAKGKR